jgi:hypothetical protein
VDGGHLGAGSRDWRHSGCDGSDPVEQFSTRRRHRRRGHHHDVDQQIDDDARDNVATDARDGGVAESAAGTGFHASAWPRSDEPDALQSDVPEPNGGGAGPRTDPLADITSADTGPADITSADITSVDNASVDMITAGAGGTWRW